MFQNGNILYIQRERKTGRKGEHVHELYWKYNLFLTTFREATLAA
jgi:hypothetical protein